MSDAIKNEAVKSWVRLCSLSELSTTKAAALSIGGQNLVLARCGDGAQVLQGYCSHMVFPLAGAKIDGCNLICGLHHSTFKVEDGSVVEWSTFPPLVGPALAVVRTRKALRTYETKVENGDVFLLWSTSDPEKLKVRIKA